FEQAWRNAQSYRPKSSGARGEQRCGIGVAAGGITQAIPAGKTPDISGGRIAERGGDGCRHAAPGRSNRRGQTQADASAGGISASRPRQTWCVLAYAREREVIFDGVFHGEGPTADFSAVHLPFNDRQKRSGQSDLSNIC